MGVGTERWACVIDVCMCHVPCRLCFCVDMWSVVVVSLYFVLCCDLCACGFTL